MAGDVPSSAIGWFGEGAETAIDSTEIFEGAGTVVEVAEVGEGLEAVDLLVLLIFL